MHRQRPGDLTHLTELPGGVRGTMKAWSQGKSAHGCSSCESCSRVGVMVSAEVPRRVHSEGVLSWTFVSFDNSETMFICRNKQAQSRSESPAQPNLMLAHSPVPFTHSRDPRNERG